MPIFADQFLNPLTENSENSESEDESQRNPTFKNAMNQHKIG